jgi:uncharacterized protein YeaO (DUF488 family)
MFRVKRVYEPAGKEDGWRVLVDRLWPRGLAKEKARVDEWVKEIAPSEALRKMFHHEALAWPAFEKRYRAELAKKSKELSALKKMEKEHGTVTLLFGAKDEKRNQAVVLAEILKEARSRAKSGSTGKR